jgi:hypothetical protein
VQHDHHAACIIAQQYSSATLVSLWFHDLRKNVSLFKNGVSFLLYFLLKLREFETV